jgi:adenosine deaminase
VILLVLTVRILPQFRITSFESHGVIAARVGVGDLCTMKSVADDGRRDLRALPKAHLHLHLPGAMRPLTLLELAERYGVNVTLEGDGSFETFAALFRTVLDVVRTSDDVVRLVREMAEDAAADGAVWVEAAGLKAASVVRRLGFNDEQPMLELLVDAARRAEREVDIGIGILVTSGRTQPAAEAEARARLAARYAGKGVVAFGLAGDETRGPPEPFAEAFAIARHAGLIAAPHGGEHCGPDSVRAAIDALGARRIQHGVRAAEDPALLERLANEAITLDVCPKSNLQLGVFPNFDMHPLRTLLEAGVPVSLNADNPLFVGSGMLAEYQLARDVFGLSDAVLAQIARCSIRASGAPESLKSGALRRISRWLDEAPSQAV